MRPQRPWGQHEEPGIPSGVSRSSALGQLPRYRSWLGHFLLVEEPDLAKINKYTTPSWIPVSDN